LFKGRIINGNVSEKYGFEELKSTPGGGHRADGMGPESGGAPESMEREAYEKGYRAGEEAGLAMGRQKAEILTDRLEKLVAELEGLRQRMLDELQPQILELSMAIAKRIVRDEIQHRPELIASMIRRAIEMLHSTGPVTIRLHPSVRDVIHEFKPELLEAAPEIVFDVDPSVDADGPIVAGPHEEIPLDIDEQLINIMKEITEAVKE